MKSFFALLFLAFGFLACTKEQVCVNRLEGLWDLSTASYYINDSLQTDSSGTNSSIKISTTYQFSKFTIKKEQTGNGQITSVYTQTADSLVGTNDSVWTVSTAFDYEILEDCNQWRWVVTSPQTIPPVTATISDIGSSLFRYNFEIDSLGDRYKWEITLTR